MTVLVQEHAAGSITFRRVSLSDLPPEPVPDEGRVLTMRQINDALALVNAGLSGRRVAGAKDAARAAMTHLVGHIAATMPKESP